MRSRTNKVWSIPVEELKKAVLESGSLLQVLKWVGLRGAPCNYRVMRKRLAEEGIVCDFPRGMDSNRGRRFGQSKLLMPLEEVLVKGSEYSRSTLKERLIKSGLLENKCAACGLGTSWNGKALSLQLDHMNGDATDNRIENLRFICPNCHSQTPTFAGRNNKKVPEKEELEKLLREHTRKDVAKKIGVHVSAIGEWVRNYGIVEGKPFSERRHASRPGAWKVAHPTKEELQQLTKELNWREIGRKFGVSDNAVRKWAKVYGLPTK
jgi:transposase-like protein